MLGGIDPRVRDRIVAETRGIPLAILEVPRSVSATELAGGFWISGKRSSAAAIEDSYVRRIQVASWPRLSSCCSSRRPNRSVTPRCFSARRHGWAFRSMHWPRPRQRESSSSAPACGFTIR